MLSRIAGLSGSPFERKSIKLRARQITPVVSQNEAQRIGDLAVLGSLLVQRLQQRDRLIRAPAFSSTIAF